MKMNFSAEPLPDLRQRRANALQTYLAFSQDPAVDQLALRRFLVRDINDPNFTSIFRQEALENAVLSDVVPPVSGGVRGANANIGVQPQGGEGQSALPLRLSGAEGG